MFIEDGKRRFVDITDSVPVKLGSASLYSSILQSFSLLDD